ncbi:MAG: hypothetical protein NVS9B7_18080 [Flavisolibacter sp.]
MKEYEPYIKVFGTVKENITLTPISGAIIVDSPSMVQTISAHTGVFNLPLRVGKHHLSISSAGYQTLELDLDIYANYQKDLFLMRENTSSVFQIKKAKISPSNIQSNYLLAIGIKYYPFAFSVKQSIGEKKMVEGLLYFWQFGSRITGLYEFETNMNAFSNLKLFAGPGAHIGFWNRNWAFIYPGRTSGLHLGVDGVIGLDYKVLGLPLNISIDWQPSLNFFGYTYFESGWGGIGIRYILK